MAIGTPKDSTMSSPERQSSFTDSLSSERSHNDDSGSSLSGTDPSDMHESPPESPSVVLHRLG